MTPTENTGPPPRYELTVTTVGPRPAGHRNDGAVVTYARRPERFADLFTAKRRRADLRIQLGPDAVITIVDHAGRTPVEVDQQPVSRDRGLANIGALRAELARAGRHGNQTGSETAVVGRRVTTTRAGSLAVLAPWFDRPDWHDHAACVGLPVEWFFPPDDRAVTIDQLERARAVCADCPARADCLAYAVADPKLDGTWAGTTVQQRRKLRNEIRRSGGVHRSCDQPCDHAQDSAKPS